MEENKEWEITRCLRHAQGFLRDAVELGLEEEKVKEMIETLDKIIINI